MRLLFVKETLAWPRGSGHDVHCYYMMRVLAQLGHDVSLLTAAEPETQAIAGLVLAVRRTFVELEAAPRNGRPALALSGLQERFRSYWGVSPARIQAVAQLADDCQADVVVVVGLEVLPYLGAVQGRCRVWYAADEWVWHYLSQVHLLAPESWGHVRSSLIHGLYERAYAPLLDRVWVVTEKDRSAMRRVAGVKAIDVLPNGVDGNHYCPEGCEQVARSCTFWGRLDFGPNIQALQWFCSRVWPLVRRQAPDAQFTIYGFQPTEPVRTLAAQEGVALVPDLPDLRPEIARHQVVVLPFVSGGGIKNKLLEAAAMGKAIICSTHACGGLRLAEQPPFLLTHSPADFAWGLLALWGDAERRLQMGVAAREWVLEHHSWTASAEAAVNGLLQSIGPLEATAGTAWPMNMRKDFDCGTSGSSIFI